MSELMEPAGGWWAMKSEFEMAEDPRMGCNDDGETTNVCGACLTNLRAPAVTWQGVMPEGPAKDVELPADIADELTKLGKP